MRAKQILYFFTRPLAKFIYLFDKERQRTLSGRQEIIRILNRRSYIDTTAKLLYEQASVLNSTFGDTIVRLNCIIQAEQMFNEKKKHGDFDDLNIMLK